MQSDKELWQSLAIVQDAAGPVSDMDFAAWLEGRLPETAAARIEAAVAADPEMRRAALELSEVLGQPLPMPSPRLEVRAKALVGFEVERFPKRGGLFDWLFTGDRWFTTQRAGALAAAVMIAVSGFLLGGGLGNSLAQEHQRYASAASSSTTDTSSEVSDVLGSDSI
jgi:hypothetical protein